MKKLYLCIAGWAVVGWLAAGDAAVACPFCNGGSDGVNKVQQEIFTRHFSPNVLRVAAPFPIFVAVAVALHYGFGAERRSPATAAEPTNLTEAHRD